MYVATLPESFPWTSQAMQYPTLGPAGISYFAGEIPSINYTVDCLLYRDSEGHLLGILNHYPKDQPPWEKAGNVNIWVHPDAKRRGIGTALLAEADRRWSINLDQQRFTPEGAAFANAYTNTEEGDPA